VTYGRAGRGATCGLRGWLTATGHHIIQAGFWSGAQVKGDAVATPRVEGGPASTAVSVTVAFRGGPVTAGRAGATISRGGARGKIASCEGVVGAVTTIINKAPGKVMGERAHNGRGPHTPALWVAWMIGEGEAGAPAGGGASGSGESECEAVATWVRVVEAESVSRRPRGMVAVRHLGSD
jgi:hypothetical protein